MAESAAVKTAKARRTQEEGAGVVTLSTGVRARLTPISAALVQDVIGRIEDPPVPTWYNKEKEEDQPNPADPEYLKAVEAMDGKRAMAALDAAIMFGIELVDGLPEDGDWIKRLKYMVKRNMLDLSDFDLDDEMDQEFLYKRYVAVSADDFVHVARLSGVPSEEVQRAARTFRG